MTPIPKTSVDNVGQVIADHLDALSLRARTASSDAAAEIERIFADHEAACAELVQQEAHQRSDEDAALRFR